MSLGTFIYRITEGLNVNKNAGINVHSYHYDLSFFYQICLLMQYNILNKDSQNLPPLVPHPL